MPSKNHKQLERALGNLISVKQIVDRPVDDIDEDVLLSEEEDSLLSNDDLMEESSTVRIDNIRPSSYRLREDIDQEALEGLVRSITNRGVIQPIILRHINDDNFEYELVAGERRLKAATLAGFEEIPAIVGDFSNQDTLEIAIIENAQREDLNPVEEALSYKRLSDEFSMTQKDIADSVGKNRSTISNSLRLLQLEEEILELVRYGDLSAGHARVLVSIDDSEKRLKLAHKVISKELSVRALERLVSDVPEPDESSRNEKDERIKRLEQRISGFLELDNVNISLDAEGRKRLSMLFPSEAAWKRFIAKIRD